MTTVCVVGASVRGTSVLERLVANLDLLPVGRLDVVLVDPHPPGAGAIWRTDQDAELLMNTGNGDQSVFVDDTVDCEGPAVPGPDMREWCRLVVAAATGRPPVAVRPDVADALVRCPADLSVLDGPLGDQVRSEATSDWYPSRALYGHYLRWCVRFVESRLPDRVSVRWERARATACRRRPDGRHDVVLDGGRDRVVADHVVLTTGWLPARPSRTDQDLARAASAAGSLWVRPGQPNEQDLQAIPSGADVVVRGLAMSFYDTMALLTVGRGGRFVADPSGDPDRLAYAPSGREPRLHVGSGRGVPASCKPRDSSVPFGVELPFLSRLRPRHEPWDVETDVVPLVRRDALWNHYRTLHRVRPGSVTSWEALQAALEQHEADAPDLAAALERLVPDPDDRIDLRTLEDPAHGSFGSPEEFDRWLERRLADDLAESRLGRDSPVRAAARAYGDARKVIAPIAEFGGLTARSYGGAYARLLSTGAGLDGGPPPVRTAQLLALVRAGVVSGIGPRMQVRHDDGRFTGWSPGVTGSLTRADVLLDARVDRPQAGRSADPLLRDLLETGRGRAHVVTDGSGEAVPTGALDVSADFEVVADGGPDPTLYALGIPVEGVRIYTVLSPRRQSNSVVLRETDHVARLVLRRAADRGSRPGADVQREEQPA